MIKRIISRLTMIKLDESFYDIVSKEVVYRWQDYYFEQYLAVSKWGFRMKLINKKD